jgi:hypothetical protein
LTTTNYGYFLVTQLVRRKVYRSKLKTVSVWNRLDRVLQAKTRSVGLLVKKVATVTIRREEDSIGGTYASKRKLGMVFLV